MSSMRRVVSGAGAGSPAGALAAPNSRVFRARGAGGGAAAAPVLMAAAENGGSIAEENTVDCEEEEEGEALSMTIAAGSGIPFVGASKPAGGGESSRHAFSARSGVASAASNSVRFATGIVKDEEMSAMVAAAAAVAGARQEEDVEKAETPPLGCEQTDTSDQASGSSNDGGGGASTSSGVWGASGSVSGVGGGVGKARKVSQRLKTIFVL